ncbi:MAG: helix-turn-helix transcriptional regulator [Bacteroidota bacterium]
MNYGYIQFCLGVWEQMGRLEKTVNRLAVQKLNKDIRNRIKPLIALQVRKYRELAKIERSDMAEVLGISYQQFQKYEQGEDHMSAITLLFIAILLDEPIEHFYEPVRLYLEE